MATAVVATGVLITVPGAHRKLPFQLPGSQTTCRASYSASSGR
jgi:hypothetical protein